MRGKSKMKLRELSSLLLLATMLLVTASCGQKETIIPLYQTETAAEQQQNRNNSDNNGQIGPNGQVVRVDRNMYFIRGKYYLSDIQVNRAVDGPILISDFGNLLADIVVRVGGQFEVDMDPLPIDVSNLDRELVKSVVIKAVKLEILDDPEDANLKFFKKVNIFINKETDDEEVDHEILLMSYNRNNDYDLNNSKKCDWKCINLNVNKLNIVNYIGNDDKIVVRSSVKIGSVPTEKFLLGGYMEFEIGLALPL